jgi:ParB family chromosome partitioning protein
VSIQTNRLGKGLDALIPSVIPNTQLNIEQIPTHLVDPNPFQPRREFNPDRLNELAHSIKHHGLTQPIIVRKVNDRFELIVGERRLQACKLNHFETIPAIVKTITDKESCEVALVENIDRENLNIIEIAHSLQRLINDFSYTQETLSQLFSRSRSSIANILRLLKLPPIIQEKIIKGEISEGHGRAMIDFSTEDTLYLELCETIITKKLSVRQTEQLIQKFKRPQQKQTQQLQLFDNYIETLSDKLNTNVRIKHRKNELTVTVSYKRFKDYISFLDQLCTIDMTPYQS